MAINKIAAVLVMMLVSLSSVSFGQTAGISDVWIDHDTEHDGEKGMMVHVKFAIRNSSGIKGSCDVLFYDQNKEEMPYAMVDYSNTDGQASSYKDFTPNSNEYQADNFSQFVPYEALDFTSGGRTYYLKCNIVYDIYGDNRVVAQSDFVPFSCINGRTAQLASSSSSSSSSTPSSSQSAAQPVNHGRPATLTMISPSSTNSKDYELRIGIKSESQVTSKIVYVNGMASRGMGLATNNGYNMEIKQTIALTAGANTIKVVVANLAGSTTQEFDITYTPSAEPQAAQVREDPSPATVAATENKPAASAEETTAKKVAEQQVEKPAAQPEEKKSGKVAKLQLLSPATSSTASYELKVGVKSPSQVTNKSIKVNSMAARGMGLAANTGNSMEIKQTIQLREGDNTILVSVTNAAGTAEEEFVVKYESAAAPAAAATPASKKVALVIGNMTYNGKKNSTTDNDINDITAKLRDLGFEVTMKSDLSQQEFDNVVTQFATKSRGSEVSLFYYAGYCAQNDHSNYLIPTDAKLASKDGLESECINAGKVLTAMQHAQKKVVLLNAMPGTPTLKDWYRPADGSPALATIDAPEATFVSYSTFAPTDKGRNTPFAQSLLSNISSKGTDITNIFSRINKQVRELTGGQQKAWYTNSLYDDFTFNK